MRIPLLRSSSLTMRKRRVFTCQGVESRRKSTMTTGTGTSTMTTNSIERLLVGQYEQHILNHPVKHVSWLQNDSHRIEHFLINLLRERHQIPTVLEAGGLLGTPPFHPFYRPHETFRTLIQSLPPRRGIEGRALFSKHLTYTAAEASTSAVFIHIIQFHKLVWWVVGLRVFNLEEYLLFDDKTRSSILPSHAFSQWFIFLLTTL
jgi:hypothetical protein